MPYRTVLLRHLEPYASSPSVHSQRLSPGGRRTFTVFLRVPEKNILVSFANVSGNWIQQPVIKLEDGAFHRELEHGEHKSSCPHHIFEIWFHSFSHWQLLTSTARSSYKFGYRQSRCCVLRGKPISGNFGDSIGSPRFPQNVSSRRTPTTPLSKSRILGACSKSQYLYKWVKEMGPYFEDLVLTRKYKQMLRVLILSEKLRPQFR